MNQNKSIRQIYKEETGEDSEQSFGNSEECKLAIFVEAPTKDYILWLEQRAFKQVSEKEEHFKSDNRNATRQLSTHEKIVSIAGEFVQAENEKDGKARRGVLIKKLLQLT